MRGPSRVDRPLPGRDRAQPPSPRVDRQDDVETILLEPDNSAVDAGFVACWSQAYLDGMSAAQVAEERTLLEEVGPAVARRGHYYKAELQRVGEWKTARIRSRLASNTDERIESVTRLALAAPEVHQHHLLGQLYGVGDPVASAFLTIWNPKLHTVLDFRVQEALEELHLRGALEGRVPGRSKPVVEYVAYCRALADRLGVELRALDRALWRWHKAGMPRLTMA